MKVVITFSVEVETPDKPKDIEDNISCAILPLASALSVCGVRGKILSSLVSANYIEGQVSENIHGGPMISLDMEKRRL